MAGWREVLPTGPSGILHAAGWVAAKLRAIEEARTERRRIEAEARVDVERLRALGAWLDREVEHTFGGRGAAFDRLFRAYDRAVERGDLVAAERVVRGIVELACPSPVATILQDARATWEALHDPDHVWEL